MNAKDEVDQNIQYIVQGYWKDKNKLMEAIEWIGKNDYSLAECVFHIRQVCFSSNRGNEFVGEKLHDLIQQRLEEMAGDEIGD